MPISDIMSDRDERRSGNAYRKKQQQQSQKKKDWQKKLKHRRLQEEAARPVAAGPSATFLAALEAQRESERQRQQQADQAAVANTASRGREESSSHQQHPVADAPSPIPPPRKAVAAIPGYHYDAQQGRYFKLTPQLKQQLEKSKKKLKNRENEASFGRRMHQQHRERQAATSSRSSSFSSALGRRKTMQGWIGYFSERESHFRWSATLRDRREIMPRWFASAMASERSVHPFFMSALV